MTDAEPNEPIYDRPPSGCGDPSCLVEEPHRKGPKCVYPFFEDQNAAYDRYLSDAANVVRRRL